MIDFPSNPTNGMVYSNYIYDSSITAWRNVNTDTGIGTLNAMGLKNIVPTSVVVGSGSASTNSNGTVTFSGATSLLLNGAFSATYKNYHVVLNVNTNSTNYDLASKFSTSGTISTTGYFAAGERRSQGGTSSTYGAGANTGQWYIGGGEQSYNNGTLTATFDVYNPFITTSTFARSKAYGTNADSSGFNIYDTGVAHDASSRDGLYLVPSGGNMSGTINIYGYTN